MENNKEVYSTERQKYLNGEISHDIFYTWLAGFIGATYADVPVSRERIRNSADPHLNDIPLHLWDSRHYNIRAKAYSKGLAWSMSDTVCVLKALAHSPESIPSGS